MTDVGVQSLDNEYKHRQLKRHESLRDIEKTIKIMKKHKIFVRCEQMLALPGEDIGSLETARRFYTVLPPDNIQTYWTNYFPGTELIQQGFAQGLLTREDIERINEGLDWNVFNNSNRNVDKGKVKTYYIYQIIFRLLPHVPQAVRRRLHPGLFSWLPARACAVISFLSGAFIILIKFSPLEYVFYFRNYYYHIKRFLLRRVGIQVRRPITRLRDTNPLILDVPKGNIKEECCGSDRILIS